MIPVNCDLGERGPEHPVDIRLMKHIQIANIACGGHAGDEESIAAFRKLAGDNGVMVSAHLSYPDRKNFGRRSIALDEAALRKSLDEQRALMPDVTTVKFHGALYNDSVKDPVLAERLGQWAKENNIETMIAPADAEMARVCRKLGIRLMAEAFAERRYTVDPISGRLVLTSRKKAYACIHDCAAAVAQAQTIANDKRVQAIMEDENGRLDYRAVAIDAATICIHSDSSIALELAQALAEKQ